MQYSKVCAARHTQFYDGCLLFVAVMCSCMQYAMSYRELLYDGGWSVSGSCWLDQLLWSLLHLSCICVKNVPQSFELIVQKLIINMPRLISFWCIVVNHTIIASVGYCREAFRDNGRTPYSVMLEASLSWVGNCTGPGRWDLLIVSGSLLIFCVICYGIRCYLEVGHKQLESYSPDLYAL